jgi:hypothetical protein
MGNTDKYVEKREFNYFISKTLGYMLSMMGRYVPSTRTINNKSLKTNVVITKEDIGLGNLTNDRQVKQAELGVPNGVATLGSNGIIKPEQLPAYIEEVIDGYYDNTTNKFYSNSGKTIEIQPQSSKIYVDITNTNHPISYRWSGSVYTAISDISTIEARVNDNESDISDIKTSTNLINASINSLNTAINEVNNIINTITQSIQSRNVLIDSHTSDISTLKNARINDENAIAKNIQDISDINAIIGEYNGRIDTIQNQIDTTVHYSSEAIRIANNLNSTVSEHTAVIENIESDVNTITTNVNTNTNNVNRFLADKLTDGLPIIFAVHDDDKVDRTNPIDVNLPSGGCYLVCFAPNNASKPSTERFTVNCKYNNTTFLSIVQPPREIRIVKFKSSDNTPNGSPIKDVQWYLHQPELSIAGDSDITNLFN